MSTAYPCPRCGGLVNAPAGYAKACTCSKPPAASETATAVATVTKVCCACGKDVAGIKRMKDSKGRYWCMECGEADRAKNQKVGGPVEVKCPLCNKMVPAITVLKSGTLFVCPECYKNKAEGKRSALGASGGGKGKLIAAVVVLALGGIGLLFYLQIL